MCACTNLCIEIHCSDTVDFVVLCEEINEEQLTRLIVIYLYKIIIYFKIYFDADLLCIHEYIVS